jgi:hypothetical protein
MIVMNSFLTCSGRFFGWVWFLCVVGLSNQITLVYTSWLCYIRNTFTGPTTRGEYKNSVMIRYPVPLPNHRVCLHQNFFSYSQPFRFFWLCCFFILVFIYFTKIGEIIYFTSGAFKALNIFILYQ